MTLSVLPVAAADLPFLHTMLYEAAFWRGEASELSVADALCRPDLALYVEQWGRPGDEGLVARVDDSPVGGVWVRRFNDAEHGFGYVDPGTPELSIAVERGYRRHGIGRCLMTAMLTALRLGGLGGVSLSVETDNPARLLYTDLGFVATDTAAGSVTMVRTLS